MKDSFVLYTKYAKHINKLNMEQRGVLFTAIFAYQKGDDLPEMDDKTDLIYGIVIEDIEACNAKWEESKQRRAEAGRKGGLAKASNANNATNERSKRSNATNATDDEAMLSNAKHNVNVYVNDNVDVNVNDNGVPTEPLDTPNGVSGAVTAPARRENPQNDFKIIMEAWNELPVTPITKITPDTKRSGNLNARIRQYGVDGVLEAINLVSQSPFLLGRVTDFVITFDWFVKPNNFVKVYEGNYNNRGQPQDVISEWLKEDDYDTKGFW